MGENNNKPIIHVKTFTNEELDSMYGKRKIEVGKCFKSESGHLYKQLSNSVLHLNIQSETEFLANTLHVGFLNDRSYYHFIEIDGNEFNNKLVDIILKLSSMA
jgi:hypothetical protein